MTTAHWAWACCEQSEDVRQLSGTRTDAPQVHRLSVESQPYAVAVASKALEESKADGHAEQAISALS